jgi:hypothetical protein
VNFIKCIKGGKKVEISLNVKKKKKKSIEFKIRVMVFHATWNNILVTYIMPVCFIEYPEKSTNLLKLTDELYHIMSTPRHEQLLFCM